MSERERRRRRKVVQASLLAVAVWGVAWAVGVSFVQSLLLSTVVTTVGAVLVALDDLDDEPGLPPLEGSGRSEGTRREVSRLSWAMAGAGNRVGGVPYRRLRAIANHRLLQRGIDLGQPDGQQAARELLGPVGFTQLVAETAGPPSERVFATCLSLVEALDGTAGHAPKSEVRR